MSETLFTALFGTACWLLLVWWQRGAQWRDWRLFAASGLWGLALLTRSLPLYFTLIVVVWVAASAAGHWQYLLRRPAALLVGCAFAITAMIVVAPWTIRNCLSYRSCILIETGLSYNLWAFNEPREDMATIFRVLETIPDPAERAAYATARGLERLREDPTILLRKLWPNWLAIWRVKAIQDRFLLEDYRADPPPLLFFAALLFDDLLYVLIAISGIAALVYAAFHRRTPAILFGLWLVYFIAVSLVTHGEGRYRHFIFFALIPYAARAWVAFRDRPHLVPKALGVALVVSGAVGLSIGMAYHWEYAIQGSLRSFWRLSGDLARLSGNLALATTAYQQAIAAHPTPDGYLALGDVLRAQQDIDGALNAYRAAQRLNMLYPPSYVRLGDLLREIGDLAAAQQAYRPQYVSEQHLLDLAWRDTYPSPSAIIDVGDGLDFGYLTGFYPAETLAGVHSRWTSAVARIRLPANSRVVRLRMAALRPDAPVNGQFCVDNICHPFKLDTAWRWLTIQLPSHTTHSRLREIELRVTPWTAPDGRTLGIVVDRIETKNKE